MKLVQTTLFPIPDLAADLTPKEPSVGVLVRLSRSEREQLNRRAREQELSTNRYVRRVLGFDD